MKIAVVDPNTLASLGMKHLLLRIVPVVHVETFGSMSELQANHPESFVHFFVAMSTMLENRDFFTAHRRKTIVLTHAAGQETQFGQFHCICTNVPEQQLVRSILALEQSGHPHGHNLPAAADNARKPELSHRETEVMTLIVKGYINKEIAQRLNIGLSTVVTHRRNIMEKLGMKSVSALTIYAVMNGYVDINKI